MILKRRFLLAAAVLVLITLAYFLVPLKRQYYEQLKLPQDLKFPIDVVFWTKWFHRERFNMHMNINDCPFPHDIPVEPQDDQAWCRISHDRSRADQAVLLAFHGHDLNDNWRDLPTRRLGQKWVFMSHEVPVNDFFPRWESISAYIDKMRMFDLTMTHRLDADIPFPYFTSDNLKTFGPNITPFSERRSIAKAEASVLWVASNCKAPNDRHEYVRELSKYIQVDSFGNCLRNGEFPAGLTIVELMSRYKFYLAIENNNCEYYVSEKIYNAFGAGAIPVASGPPGSNGTGYKHFVPTQNSAIYMDDYPNPKDLADVLKRIEASEELWNERQAYRTTGQYSDDFKKFWGKTHLDWGECGLCRRAARERWKDIQDVKNTGGFSNMNGNSVRPDFSCKPYGHLRPVS